MIECFFDGACEPVNPGGTAAWGAVVFKNGKRIWSSSGIVNPVKGREKETSNNVAEYSGLIAILNNLDGMGWSDKEIRIKGDSKLVIMQMSGKWKIRGGFYVPYAEYCLKKILKFPRLKMVWIPREENGVADELSKQVLDAAGVEFRLQKR